MALAYRFGADSTRETLLNTKLLHKKLKCYGACHEGAFLRVAVNGLPFMAAKSSGRASCFKSGTTASGAPEGPHLPVVTPENAGNRCTILDSIFRSGLDKKRFITNPITLQPSALFQKTRGKPAHLVNKATESAI